MDINQFKLYAKELREGTIHSVELNYDDENATDLFVFLSLNTDICFDGISITLCNQQL